MFTPPPKHQVGGFGQPGGPAAVMKRSALPRSKSIIVSPGMIHILLY